MTAQQNCAWIAKRARELKNLAEQAGCTGQLRHPAYSLWAMADKALGNADRGCLHDAEQYLRYAEEDAVGVERLVRVRNGQVDVPRQ